MADAIEDLFRDFVPVRSDFKRSQRNVDDARRALRTLVGTVSAILHESPSIPARKANKELLAILKHACGLRDRLRDSPGQPGFRAVLQHAGYIEGQAHDLEGSEADANQLLVRLSRDLDALIKLTDVQPMVPQKGGNPGDARRDRALGECAKFFDVWADQRVSATEESKFSAFASAVFQHLGQDRASNMRGRIKKLASKS